MQAGTRRFDARRPFKALLLQTYYGTKVLGAQGRNRTTDTVIFSHVLYQLSYLGISADGGSAAGYSRLTLSSQAPRGSGF